MGPDREGAFCRRPSVALHLVFWMPFMTLVWTVGHFGGQRHPLKAAGATVLLFNSRRLPDPLLVVANAGLSAALVSLLTEAGAIGLVSPEL